MTLLGCSEATKPEPTPAPIQAVAPVAVSTPATGDMNKVKTHLETGLTALKAKNYADAATAVDAAGKELTAVAGNANLPAAIKATVAKTSESLAPLKALIEKKDPNAEKSLTASLAGIGKLSMMISTLSSGGEMMKGAAAGAADALGGMMKTATDQAGAASSEMKGSAEKTTGAAAEKVGEMMPKKK